MATSGDIINWNGEIWLSQEFILKHVEVGYNYLRVAKTRASQGGQSWKHAEIDSRVYFSYSTLPRTAANKLDPPGALLPYAKERHDDIANIVTVALYNHSRNFGTLPPEVAKSAAVIHEAHVYCKQNGISYSKSSFFEHLATEVELQGLKYLPRTWRNLRDKVRGYELGMPIHELISPKNEGNQNRAVFANNDLIKGWLVELAESRKNFSYAHIHRKIGLICAQYCIASVPSQRWVTDYLNRADTKFLVQRRYGENTRFNCHYRTYVPTQSALFAGDCWEMDGTRVNITEHGVRVVGKDGKTKTEYRSLYIVAVRDVMSGMVLGWEYCYTESEQVINNAIAMAVRTAGHLPYELRYDRFPGHTTEAWANTKNNLQRAGVIMTQTSVAEGKAHIERWWGMMQSIIMMESDLYYGEGIRSSRRSAHRAKEYIANLRKWAVREGFDFDAAAAATDSMINSWNDRPYNTYSRKHKDITQSPAQLHNKSDKPNTYPIAMHKYCWMFGIRKEVSIRNHMIMTQIDNATYYYGIDDVAIIERYTGIKLTNCFDPEDFGTVHLYQDETYLGTFSRIEPAQQYGPDKDMRAVGKLKAIAEKVKNHRKAKLSDIGTRKETCIAIVDEMAGTHVGAVPCGCPEHAGSESSVLSSGRIPKSDYEAAETACLHEHWGTEGEEEVNTNTNVINQL